jgi:hypothetical protein
VHTWKFIYVIVNNFGNEFFFNLGLAENVELVLVQEMFCNIVLHFLNGRLPFHFDS